MRSGYRPFHGVISLGLIDALRTAGQTVDWASYSAWLDPALANDPEAVDRVPSDLLDLARSCHVLRFEDSISVTEMFLRRHLREVVASLDAAFDPDQVEGIEMWNLKEGHTSSVWRVTVSLMGEQAPVRFALNVARDAAAGEELLASAAILENLDRRSSEIRVAHVLKKAQVPIRLGNESSVPVVAQEWIDDACELGFLKQRHTRGRSLYAIERFVTADNAPGRIDSVLGYRLESNEHDRAIYEIITATLMSSTFDLLRDQVLIPCFEINQGDWIWSRGHAYLVATSSGHKVLRLGEALPYFLFHLPTTYEVVDSEVCAALIRMARTALKDFCARDNTLTLSSWADRSRAVSWQPWQSFEYGGTRATILDSLVN